MVPASDKEQRMVIIEEQVTSWKHRGPGGSKRTSNFVRESMDVAYRVKLDSESPVFIAESYRSTWENSWNDPEHKWPADLSKVLASIVPHILKETIDITVDASVDHSACFVCASELLVGAGAPADVASWYSFDVDATVPEKDSSMGITS